MDVKLNTSKKTGERLFCSKPFQWFEVFQGNEIGDIYLCCPTWLNKIVGNLQHQTVAEIWNGEKAQEIRRSIQDGSFRYCDRKTCPYLQTETGPVQRVEDITDQDLKDAIEGDLTILPYGPRAINCSYDRSCNLSCPSCRSELIIEDKNKDQILSTQNRIQTEALTDAHLLYITGSGDPFGSPYFRRWLQTMKLADMPNLKEIYLHTNAMSWTPRMWETIPPDIRLLIRDTEISIDAATAKTYSINRRGGDFTKLTDNLKFISSLRKNGSLRNVKISMVVQENNFLEMPAFVDLGRRMAFDNVFFTQLINWGTYAEDDYAARCVHLPAHPRHGELRDLLKDETFDDPIVQLGNLTDIRPVAPARRKAPGLLPGWKKAIPGTLSARVAGIWQ
jgi:hypothetical protein